MKKGLFFLATLAFLLVGLSAFDLPFKTDSGSKVYAFGRRPGNECPGGGHSTPEPSALILLGSGIVGIAGYKYYKHKKDDKSKR